MKEFIKLILDIFNKKSLKKNFGPASIENINLKFLLFSTIAYEDFILTL